MVVLNGLALDTREREEAGPVDAIGHLRVVARDTDDKTRRPDACSSESRRIPARFIAEV